MTGRWAPPMAAAGARRCGPIDAKHPSQIRQNRFMDPPIHRHDASRQRMFGSFLSPPGLLGTIPLLLYWILTKHGMLDGSDRALLPRMSWISWPRQRGPRSRRIFVERPTRGATAIPRTSVVGHWHHSSLQGDFASWRLQPGKRPGVVIGQPKRPHHYDIGT
jgi:hypothetical protein